MFMRPFVSNAAPRQNYRDIADAFDRMGQFYPGYGYARTGDVAVPPAGTMMSLDPAVQQQLAMAGCGTLTCCPPAAETVGRIKFLGLPRICVPGCDHETVDLSPCGTTTLIGFYIPPKIADCLLITRFRVGCWDLLASCDPISASVFSCCEMDENVFGSKTVSAGVNICIDFENTCKADIPLEGTLKILSCEEC